MSFGAAKSAGLFDLTDVPTTSTVSPAEFALEQDYPNLFNPSTTIRYTVGGVRDQVPGTSVVRLAVYDILARKVTVLGDERQGWSEHEVRFDGSRLVSGVYYYELRAGANRLVHSMALVR